MTARVLKIEERHLKTSGWHASLADFTLSEGEEVDPAVVVENPDLSLYCLDEATERAIFVELPPGMDLTKVPFVYLTQGEQAERLIAVPYDTFLNLAVGLPEVENLVLIYSTGRSGSTLLSNVFNELGTAMSLSEPDVPTQIAYLRSADGSRDAELSRLMASAARFMFKTDPHRRVTTRAVKFRSQAIPAMDLYGATFPRAKSLLTYRGAVGWVTSWYRVFKDAGDEDYQPLSEWLPFFERIYRRDAGEVNAYLGDGEVISLVKFIALQWLVSMEDCLTQHERGVQALAVRYDDLNTHREAVLHEIFSYCGLPLTNVNKALRAFEKDAQAGTLLARVAATQGNTLRLTDQQIADIHHMLERHPVINTPNFVLPGTLTL